MKKKKKNAIQNVLIWRRPTVIDKTINLSLCINHLYLYNHAIIFIINLRITTVEMTVSRLH